MEIFFSTFLQAVFTAGGVVAISFLFGLIYQTRQLKLAQAECRGLNGQILQLATSQIATMKEVQKVLEKVVDAMPETGAKHV